MPDERIKLLPASHKGEPDLIPVMHHPVIEIIFMPEPSCHKLGNTHKMRI